MAGASAQSTDDLLAKFASTKFDDIEAGINGLATSGDSRALPVLQALTDGRLLLAADKHAYIKAADSGSYDGIVVAVAHDEFIKLGAKGIRSFGSPNAVIFDIKHVLQKGESDGRL
jgi:hypothetical protein